MTEQEIKDLLESYQCKLKKYEYKQEVMMGKDERGKNFYQDRININFFTPDNKSRTLNLANTNTLEQHLKKYI
jgi:hypothetical protein